MATLEQRQVWQRRGTRKYRERKKIRKLLSETLEPLPREPLVTIQFPGRAGAGQFTDPWMALYAKELAVLFNARALPQQDVLLARFDGVTHQEIGQSRRVSRARAQQVERDGWAEFRAYVEAEEGKLGGVNVREEIVTAALLRHEQWLLTRQSVQHPIRILKNPYPELTLKQAKLLTQTELLLSPSRVRKRLVALTLHAVAKRPPTRRSVQPPRILPVVALDSSCCCGETAFYLVSESSGGQSKLYKCRNCSVTRLVRKRNKQSHWFGL